MISDDVAEQLRRRLAPRTLQDLRRDAGVVVSPARRHRPEVIILGQNPQRDREIFAALTSATPATPLVAGVK